MKKTILLLSLIAFAFVVTAQNNRALEYQFATNDTVTADTNFSIAIPMDAMYDYSIAMVAVQGANTTQVAKIYVQGSNDDASDIGSVASDSWYNLDTLTVTSSVMAINSGVSTGTRFMGKYIRVRYDVTTNGSAKFNGWFVAKKSW